MTSPDHYRLAEQFAEEAYNELRHDDQAGATALAAIAQVHASLAIAEAIRGVPSTGSGPRTGAADSRPSVVPSEPPMTEKPVTGRPPVKQKSGPPGRG
jgi:hypothetical protein